MPALSTHLRNALQEIFGDDGFLTDPSECWPYGYDNSKLQQAPLAVVFAYTHEQVVDLVQLCKQYKVPISTRGRGTGTTGAAVPSAESIVLSMERMNQILDIDPGNRSVRVQPGVTNKALQDYLEPHGFFWGPDPSSAEYCTVGGNIACGAAGPRAVKYGTTRENTLSLKIVTGNGDTITTGTATSKGVVGLDLTRLLIGSEGTLAIVTEALLKLTPKPSHQFTLRAIYADHETACEAIQSLMTQKQTPSALEFMDHNAVKLLQDHAELSLPGLSKAILMVDVDGESNTIESKANTMEKHLHDSGAIDIQIARDHEQSKTIWAARKALSPALRSIAPNKINEDVVVPIPKIAELIRGLDKISEEYGIPIVNFGHAGNGNIHVNLLYDTNDEKQQSVAEECLRKVFTHVLALGGTLSGEHGVGIAKRDYIAMELKPKALHLMHAIKKVFDPENILNPGKSLPPEV